MEIKLFYATKNKFKIEQMEDRIKGLGINLITPYDIDINIEVKEIGKTVLDNALIKAKTYYNLVKLPVIAADSSLYVEKFRSQPGIYVRRVNGKYLEDDEIEEYYIDQLNRIGGESLAYYVTGLALIKDNKIFLKEIKEDKFILTNRICKAEKTHDQLSRIEFDIKLNKYFCEITKEDKEKIDYIFDEKCVEFIKDVLEI